MDHRGWRAKVIDITFAKNDDKEALENALTSICEQADQAIEDGYALIILSDRNISQDRMAISTLIACGTVHHHLNASHKRTRIGLVLETGEAREVHHHCLLIGYGADAINPYLAFESLWQAKDDGLLDETDVLSAEATIATREAELISLRNRVDRSTDDLAHIIQWPRVRSASPEFIYPDSALTMKSGVPDKKALYKLAIENRSDLTSLIAAAQRAELDVKSAKSAGKPDLSIFGSIDKGSSDMSRSDSLGVDEDGWGVGVKFETALSRTAEKSAIRNAERESKKASNDVADMKAAIDYECRAVARVLSASLEQVAATRRATELRERRLKLEQEKFDQGRSDTRWVVQAQDELVRSRMASQISIANAHKAEAASRAAAGTERRKR